MLEIRPCHIREAREFVKEHHRHNIPPVGGKFAVACYDGDRICGVVIAGRPVARYSDNGRTLEILRCCTDGTYNACSNGAWWDDLNLDASDANIIPLYDAIDVAIDDGGTYGKTKITDWRKPMHPLEHCSNKKQRNRTVRPWMGIVSKLPHCAG